MTPAVDGKRLQILWDHCPQGISASLCDRSGNTCRMFLQRILVHRLYLEGPRKNFSLLSPVLGKIICLTEEIPPVHVHPDASAWSHLPVFMLQLLGHLFVHFNDASVFQELVNSSSIVSSYQFANIAWGSSNQRGKYLNKSISCQGFPGPSG